MQIQFQCGSFECLLLSAQQQAAYNGSWNVIVHSCLVGYLCVRWLVCLFDSMLHSKTLSMFLSYKIQIINTYTICVHFLFDLNYQVVASQLEFHLKSFVYNYNRFDEIKLIYDIIYTHYYAGKHLALIFITCTCLCLCLLVSDLSNISGSMIQSNMSKSFGN